MALKILQIESLLSSILTQNNAICFPNRMLGIFLLELNTFRKVCFKGRHLDQLFL